MAGPAYPVNQRDADLTDWLTVWGDTGNKHAAVQVSSIVALVVAAENKFELIGSQPNVRTLTDGVTVPQDLFEFISPTPIVPYTEFLSMTGNEIIVRFKKSYTTNGSFELFGKVKNLDTNEEFDLIAVGTADDPNSQDMVFSEVADIGDIECRILVLTTAEEGPILSVDTEWRSAIDQKRNKKVTDPCGVAGPYLIEFFIVEDGTTTAIRILNATVETHKVNT